MNDFLLAILGFVIAIGLLTTVHEFGHFWLARMMGVKVLRFSIGFGKPLITWLGSSGTEYAISSIPLGGYVKMLDHREAPVAPNEQHLEFNHKPIWARMLIIAAGPFFNILFAVVAYWLMFLIGISSIVPVLGDVPAGSVADIAGLKAGQEIVAINDTPTPTWEDIAVNLIGNLGNKDFIRVTTYDPTTRARSEHALNLSHWSLNDDDQNALLSLGITPIDPLAPIVDKTVPGYPAAEAGLRSGDLIIDVDGQAITSRSQFMHVLRDKYNRATHMIVLRNKERIDILITPVKKLLEGGDATGYIGIQFTNQAWPKELIRTQRFGIMPALSQALDRTADYTLLTLKFLKKMVTGQMSLQHIAGPISIAKFAGRTVASGLEYFLGFLSLVSISLAVLNMLPIPILDGGHFLYCCIELVSGRALSERAMRLGNALGYVILGSFMLLAIHNDVLRLMY